MTPRASTLYFSLLDDEMAKSAGATRELLTDILRSTKVLPSMFKGGSFFSRGADDLLGRLAARAVKAGLEVPTRSLSPSALKEFTKVLENAESSAGKLHGAAMARKLNVPAALGIAGGAGIGGGYLGYSLGGASRDEELERNRMLAYGGGIATGLAAPSILRGLNSVVSNQGLLSGAGDDYMSEFMDI